MLIFDVKFTTVFVCFAMAMISGCHHSPQLANTNQGSDSSESGHFFKPTIEYWKRINQDEKHQIPYANIIRARQQAKEHQARAQTMPQDRSVPSGTWVFRGPDNWSGRTRSLLIDPRNSNSMLAGGVTGGLWHSDDGGSNWSPVTEGLSSLEICALTRDPQNLDTIYLGTGEAPLATQPVGDTDEWIAPYVFGGEGIFKSTDNGQTWSNLNSTSTWTAVAMITVNPGGSINGMTIPRRLFAAGAGMTGSFNGQETSGGGIAYSEDDGETWIFAQGITQPAQGNVGFEVTVNGAENMMLCTNYESYIDGTEVYRSLDGGQNWVSALYSTGSGSYNNFSELGASKISVAAAGNAAIATIGGGPQSGSVYLSRDGGSTYNIIAPPNTIYWPDYWKTTSWISPESASLDFTICGGGVTTSCATLTNDMLNPNIDPPSPNEFQWSTITPGASVDASILHVDHHLLLPDPGFNGSSNKKIWMATDGGMWSINDFTNPNANTTTGWEPRNNNYTTTQFYGCAAQMMTPYDPNSTMNLQMSGGMQDQGTQIFNINATTPDGESSTLNGANIACCDGLPTIIHPVQTGYMFLGTTSVALMRHFPGYVGSYENNVVGAFLHSPDPTNWVWPMAFGSDPVHPKLYVGVGTLKVLDDPLIMPLDNSGNDFIDISPPDSFSTSAISAIAINPANPKEIWVGYNDGVILACANGDLRPASDGTWPDGEITWQLMNPQGFNPARCITRLTFVSQNSNTTPFTSTVYASTGAFLPGNIHKFTGSTTQWTDVTGTGGESALPHVPVIGFAVHPQNEELLYAGTSLGLYRSTDGGDTWNLYNNGGPGFININGLHFARDTPQEINGQLTRSGLTPVLAIGTHGRGLWTIHEEIPAPLWGDVNEDCSVDIEDLLHVIGNWGGPDGDIDGDGTTNIDDLLHAIEAWGDTCE